MVASMESQSSRGLRKVFMGEKNLRCQSLSSVRKEKTRRTLVLDLFGGWI